MTAPSTATLPSNLDADPAPKLAAVDLGRRSRKKNKTRFDLMEAGAKLFETRGFDETTTTEIADLADVSQRTLFRHFPTKEALLYGDMDELRLELRDEFASRPSDEPILKSVREALIPLINDFDEQQPRRLLQARLAAKYPSVSAYSRAVVQASWEREIIIAVSERLGVDPMLDPRPEIVAGASMSAIRMATRQWTASGGQADYVELVSQALSTIGTLSQLD